MSGIPEDTLKVKYADFNQVTRSKTIGNQIKDQQELAELTRQLLVPIFPVKKGVRLLGVTLSSLNTAEVVKDDQLDLAL